MNKKINREPQMGRARPEIPEGFEGSGLARNMSGVKEAILRLKRPSKGLLPEVSPEDLAGTDPSGAMENYPAQKKAGKQLSPAEKERAGVREDDVGVSGIFRPHRRNREGVVPQGFRRHRHGHPQALVCPAAE